MDCSREYGGGTPTQIVMLLIVAAILAQIDPLKASAIGY